MGKPIETTGHKSEIFQPVRHFEKLVFLQAKTIVFRFLNIRVYTE